MLKGIRIRNTPGNSNVTVGTSITGLPVAGSLPGGTTLALATQDATGWTISGTSNLTFTGTTGNTVSFSLLIS